MFRTELLLSHWESALFTEESFWNRLGKAVAAKKITSIGIPLLSPYGLSYDSKKLREFVHMKDFVNSSIHRIEKLAAGVDVDMDLWCSVLYNNFLKEGYHQLDNEGKHNEDFVCPNHPELSRVLKDIFADTFDQEWFRLMALNKKPGIILDAVHFFDFNNCLCDFCLEAFERESNVDKTTFRRLMQEDRIFTEPLLFRKWVMFRSKSLARLLQDILSYIRSNFGETSAVYSGFADESLLLSGFIKQGCLLEDFIQADVDQVIIRSAERWLYDSGARNEALFMLPFSRDAILEKGKQVALIAYGYHMQNEIENIIKLAQKTGIDAILFAPFSSAGVEELIRYYVSP